MEAKYVVHDSLPLFIYEKIRSLRFIPISSPLRAPTTAIHPSGSEN